MEAYVFMFMFCVVEITSTAADDSVFNFYNEHVLGRLERQSPSGAMGRFLQYPEMTLEPSLEGDENLIVYTKGRLPTSQKYVSRLENVLRVSEDNMYGSDNLIDCSSMSAYKHPENWDKICRYSPNFELYVSGDDYMNQCMRQHLEDGYMDGLPCILLGLDRILNWMPEPYINETVPDEIKDVWVQGNIPVTCEGTDPVSVDNIYDVQTNPKSGFHYKYFPYTGQVEWLTPLVQVYFIATPAVAVEIRCKAWAQNIVHSDLLNTGSVKFTVMIN